MQKRVVWWRRLGAWLRRLIALLLNPRFLLCFGIAWLITNGWAYALLGIGVWNGIGWMSAVAGGYLAFIWLPIAPEKLLTTAIAILLLRHFFPNDEKTLGVLREWHRAARAKLRKRKQQQNDSLQKNEEKDS